MRIVQRGFPTVLVVPSLFVLALALAASPPVLAGGLCNTPPQAQNDTVRVGFGGSHLFDPIRNDRDADGDPLVLQSVANPAFACSGTITQLADQLVRFTPTGQSLPGGALSCTAAYSISDGEISDTGTVTLTFPSEVLFADSFESGNTGAWTEVVTGP